MGSPVVYIETTIPSFHHDVRTSPDTIARRDWTRRWWSTAHDRYRLVTSDAVIEELEGGTQEHAEARRASIADLPLLPVGPAIGEIVDVYIRHSS